MTTFLYFYDLFRLADYSKASSTFINSLSKNKAFKRMSMESVNKAMAQYYGHERA